MAEVNGTLEYLEIITFPKQCIASESFVAGQRSIERICLFASWAIDGSMIGICCVESWGEIVCAELICVTKNKLPKTMRRKVMAEEYFINKLSNNNVKDELVTRQYTKICKKRGWISFEVDDRIAFTENILQISKIGFG